jgi:hypothetical protein
MAMCGVDPLPASRNLRCSPSVCSADQLGNIAVGRRGVGGDHHGDTADQRDRCDVLLRVERRWLKASAGLATTELAVTIEV